MSRIDLYTLPHKSLRAAIGEAAIALSSTYDDRLARDLDVVDEVLAYVDKHAAHESEFIDPLLARCAPELLTSIVEQHEAIEAVVEDLRARVAVARRHGVADVGSIGELHRRFQRFNAMFLVHLDEEEAQAMSVLWANLDDDELAAVMDRFRVAHPDAVSLYRRWPEALSPQERSLVGVL